MARSVIIVAHNIRSTHNVGAILRTAEGLGIDHVYLTGYTPYPRTKNDQRLPHLADKTTAQISKTALGAERFQQWNYRTNIELLINSLSEAGYELAALEIVPEAVDIQKFKPSSKIALLVGSEVDGLSEKILKLIPLKLQIPMEGCKESFNVSIAAAIAMYCLTTVK